MNGNFTQESSQKERPFNLVLVLPLVLLLGIFAGFVFSAYFLLPPKQVEKSQACPQTPACKVDEEKLPIGLTLLQNPVVYQWRGSVEGKLIGKDEHTFTLEDKNGYKIDITDITPTGEVFKTIFAKRSNGIFIEVSLKDIPVGTILRGDFWVFKGGKNTSIGGRFEIVEE